MAALIWLVFEIGFWLLIAAAWVIVVFIAWLILGTEGLKATVSTIAAAALIWYAGRWLKRTWETGSKPSSGRTPPSDPIDRHHWANRTGKYSTNEPAEAERDA